jgi:hypothetical protein
VMKMNCGCSRGRCMHCGTCDACCTVLGFHHGFCRVRVISLLLAPIVLEWCGASVSPWILPC